MEPAQGQATGVLSIDDIDHLARELVAEAKRSGVMVTITEHSLTPLAMGNLEMVVNARAARSAVLAPLRIHHTVRAATFDGRCEGSAASNTTPAICPGGEESCKLARAAARSVAINECITTALMKQVECKPNDRPEFHAYNKAIEHIVAAFRALDRA